MKSKVMKQGLLLMAFWAIVSTMPTYATDWQAKTDTIWPARHYRELNGKATGSCTLTSASDKTELRLIPENESAAPEGLCYVRLRYTDENGEEIESLIQEIDKSNIQAIAIDLTPSSALLSQLIQCSESNRIALVQIREVGN